MGTIDFNNVRLTTPVPHKVIAGPKFGGDIEKVSATLDIVIQASDFADLLDYLFPQPTVIGDLVSIQPRAYLLGAPWLRAKSFQTDEVQPGLPIDPFGADASAPDGTYGTLMKMQITFETDQESEDEEPDENDPVTFLDHSLNAGAEYLHIPPAKTQVAEDIPAEQTSPDNPAFQQNKDMQLGIYKVIPTVEHTLKWKYAIKPAWRTIIGMIGMLNDSVIPVFNDAPIETVLFTGISGSRSYRYFRRRTNTTPWQLDFKFSERCVKEGNTTFGWNHVYSPLKGKWVKVKRADGSFLYKLDDFTQLFKAQT